MNNHSMNEKPCAATTESMDPVWDVHARVSGTKYLGRFRAKTAEEAIELAIQANGRVSLCHQCAAECEDGEVDKAEACQTVDDGETRVEND